jgi:lipopolysaccharide export system protein LptA
MVKRDMRVTVKRLRLWIVVVAILLLAVLVGFFFYGRNRYRRIARDLPARLGMNIQQTATGFSYSQSSQGHTLFTLQASKEFQMKSGHVLLHNVDITLYGPPDSGRKDHIYGSDFDYDQSQGIAISHGKVRIQLEGLGAGSGKQGSGSRPASGVNVIQVRTSGLIFEQKTGQAATAQPVQFELPRGAGSAVGAQYDSRTGELVLDHAVRITTRSNGSTATIGAAHATLQRATMRALVTEATLDYRTEHGSADQATVNFRKDGTAERIDAQGHVRMETNQGAATEAATGVILLNAQSQPVRVDLGGGIAFAETRPGEKLRGTAEAATLLFAPVPGSGHATEPRHAEFRSNVRLTEVATQSRGEHAGSAVRTLEAQHLSVDLVGAAKGEPLEARRAVAQGNPVVTMRQVAAKEPGLIRTTRISGDHLVATFGAGNMLREMNGTGHTQVESVSSDGARETSRGDVLLATFGEIPAKHGPSETQTSLKPPLVPGGTKKRPRREEMQTVLETATQDGNVVLTEIPASPRNVTSAAAAATRPGAAPPEPLTAWAQHAEYRAAAEDLTLSGHPRMRQGETMQMSAVKIVYRRATQDAEGEGDVKATYSQQAQETARGAVPVMGGNGPVHVIAGRAEMHHATGEADFYGTRDRRARMWQGADSLLAPRIEIDRKKDSLRAWGSAVQPQVLANFTSAMGAGHQETPVSVESRKLDYSDRRRQADFEGDVTARHGDEAIRADDALVILTPDAKSPGAKPGKANAEIERVVATGQVEYTQPGRRGTGAKLVYTADDGKYVLTGTPKVRPRLWDRAHGTTTGAALIFNSQNDSVEVSGGKSSAVTITRAPR